MILLLSAEVCAETISGHVVAVYDGDTVTVLDQFNHQYKVRLSGIDAPERKQAFGTVSRNALSNMIFGKQVVVTYSKLDRNKRPLGKIFIDDQDVNLAMIKNGMAWHFTKYQKTQSFEDRLNYLHAQMDAEKQKIGLWTDPHPVPPWEFRKSKKKK